MPHTFFCSFSALFLAQALWAQAVPARDLLQFPLGAVLEPAAFAAEPGAGLWNPAAGTLAPGDRWRFGVAALTPTADQGVDGRLISAAWRRRNGVTVNASIARFAIANIIRTESDPTAVGDVTYNSLLVSIGASRDVIPNVTVGVSARWREGRADREVRDAVAADLGFVIHDLPWRNARVAVSSFLWRPGREIDDRPAVLAAIDARVAGTAGREFRAGYSHNGVTRGAQEDGPFASMRLDLLEARAAFLRTTSAGHAVSRIRSGLALHFTRYVVGLAREEGASGLGPLYQFTLSTTIR